MKRFIIFIAAVLIAGTGAFAQKKGDMYIGGGVEFGVNTRNISDIETTVEVKMKTVNFSLSPTFAYFVINNLRVGGSLIVDTNFNDYTNEGIFLLGPEISYYVRIVDNFYYTPEYGVYGGVGLIGTEISDYTMGVFATKLDFAKFEFRPTPRLGFEINLAGLEYKYMNEAEETVMTTFSRFNLDIGAGLALKYYF